MKGNLKALGLALVAVFAMSAIVASAASAQQSHEFQHSGEGGKAILTGDDDGAQHLFRNTPGAAPVKCDASFLSMADEAEVNTLEVKPTYTNCEWEENEAEVRTNGCAYVFGSDTSANGHAPVSIVCEQSTERIEVQIGSLCTLKFGPQTADQGVSYTNKETTPESVTVKATATGIDFTKSGSFCFLVTGGTTGVYEGNSTIKAYENEGTTGTTTTPGTVTEGAQVNATVNNN